MARPGELRRVRTRGQEQPNFLAVLGILVILFDAFANFCWSHSDDGVNVCVVVGGPLEDFHTQNALFQLIGLTAQSARDDKPQEAWISLAGMKQRRGEE